MVLLLVPILLLGGIAFIAQVGSIGASDGCQGCDTSPPWGNVAEVAAAVLLVVWLIFAVVLLVRGFARRFAKPS
jgi:hypothetical protein